MSAKKYSNIKTSPYFYMGDGLNRENKGDCKVGMLSEIDMSSAQALRKEIETESGLRPSYTALLVKALALALRKHPHANRVPIGYLRQRLIQLHDVDVSVAVERDLPGVEQAVFVGTILHADDKDLATITAELRDLSNVTPETNSRWRTFKWIVEHLPTWLGIRIVSLPRWFASMWVEHRGGASLISSPAKYGVDMMVAAWPWPIGFSFGLVKDRPIAVDGAVVIRPTMTLTMSFDRRMLGGAPAARFFNSVADNLLYAQNALRQKGNDVRTSSEYEGDIQQQRKMAKA